MTRPRSQLVSLETTPYYHSISRCVRRAFLYGKDPYSGKNFDHRKAWLVERLGLLTDIFAIDVAAYAVMSNHYHLVLHIDTQRAVSWSMKETLFRWTRLYKGPTVVQEYLAGRTLDEPQMKFLQLETEIIRGKLACISRFMSCMNEYLARKANAEDNCTGRFWEGRFKSQALLDEKALLSCMAYVDLNPIRAGIASSLQASDYTSVQTRIKQVESSSMLPKKQTILAKTPRLMPFSESLLNEQSFSPIPFNLRDYLDIVEWTARSVRQDKKGSISHTTPKLLNTLGLTETQWRVLALDIQKQSITMLSGLMVLQKLEKRRIKTVAA